MRSNMKHKMNWGLRFKNPNFVFRVFATIVFTILGYFQLEAQDMTTWQSVITGIVDTLSNPYLLFIIIWNVWNISVDPTTKGIYDSELSLVKTTLDQTGILPDQIVVIQQEEVNPELTALITNAESEIEEGGNINENN